MAERGAQVEDGLYGEKLKSDCSGRKSFISI